MIVFRAYNGDTKIVYTDNMSIEQLTLTMAYYETVLNLTADTRRLFR